MFQLDVLIDTTVLPSDVMSLRDDKFIDFVKLEAGNGAADLLEIQGINCVKSLLMTSDIYSIMNVPSKSLDDFKNKYGYMQDDGTYTIQPGIKGNMEYLIDLLKKKCMEDAKLARYSKYNQLMSSVASNNSSEKILSKSSNLSINEHKKYIIDTLNIWCDNNKSRFTLPQLSFFENQHYFISLFNDPSGALKGDIKCGCGKWSSFTLRREKFQLSNFYRHLHGSNNMCPQLKSIANNPQLLLTSPTNPSQSLTLSSPANLQQSLPLSSVTNLPQSFRASDNPPHSMALSNFISIRSPPYTTQSVLNLPITLADNDETVMHQSPLLKTPRQAKRKLRSIEISNNTRESVKRTRRR